MQSHPLRRTHFGQYQASSAMLVDREIDCTEYDCYLCDGTNSFSFMNVATYQI